LGARCEPGPWKNGGENLNNFVEKQSTTDGDGGRRGRGNRGIQGQRWGVRCLVGGGKKVTWKEGGIHQRKGADKSVCKAEITRASDLAGGGTCSRRGKMGGKTDDSRKNWNRKKARRSAKDKRKGQLPGGTEKNTK